MTFKSILKHGKCVTFLHRSVTESGEGSCPLYQGIGRNKKKMDEIRSITIEPFKIVGNWDVQSRRLKEKFSELTDEDIKLVAGKENDLLMRLVRRLNKTRDEVISLLRRGEPKIFKTI